MKKLTAGLIAVVLLAATNSSSRADEATSRKWMDFLAGHWTGEIGERDFKWAPGKLALQYELRSPDGDVVAVGLMAYVAGNDSVMHTMHSAEGMIARILYNEISDDELKGSAVYLRPDGSRLQATMSLRKDGDDGLTAAANINGEDRTAVLKRKSRDG